MGRYVALLRGINVGGNNPQGRISKIVTLSIYPRVTIRNWNTTSALLRLMDVGSGSRGGIK